MTKQNYTTDALIVAEELKSAGFQTQPNGNQVNVSLKNRKVGKMEVEFALDQIFEMEFAVRSTNKGVAITL